MGCPGVAPTVSEREPLFAAITRLVGSQLLEQQEEWQLERRRFFSEATMAKIPEPEEPLDLTDGDPSVQPAATIS
jgi:putative transposase